MSDHQHNINTPDENQHAKEIKFALEEQLSQENEQAQNEEENSLNQNLEDTTEQSSQASDLSNDQIVQELECLHQELEQVKQERDEYLGDMKRLQAEFDNFRKRSNRERSEMREFLMQDFIKRLLGVVESLERALNLNMQSHNIESYHQGVEMVYQQLMGILGENGLVKINTVGELFDPNIHEAVMEVETNEHEPGTIIQELTPGYMLKERVISAPKVQIAKAISSENTPNNES